jgi:hypothetical protein
VQSSDRRFVGLWSEWIELMDATECCHQGRHFELRSKIASMTLSEEAHHYLESLWGERLRELMKERDSGLDRVRQGLMDPSQIYARKGFRNYLQPYLDHVRAIGIARSDCWLKAYKFDGQSLSPTNIDEILRDAAFNMDSAANTLIGQKKNEMQSARPIPGCYSDPIPEPSEVSLLFAEVQRDAKELLRRRLTIQMYESTEKHHGSVAANGGNRRGLRTAEILQVLIASPSDVNEERDGVTKTLLDWNAAYSSSMGIMLDPVRWETHAFPESGERTQAILNQQIVDDADLLIGIFGCRLGTATGEAQSGTIEEIERFRKSGKPVALYFSSADVPRNANRDQLEHLEAYQEKRKKDTIYFTFGNVEELCGHLSRHLPKLIQKVRTHLQSPCEPDGPGRELRAIDGGSGQMFSPVAPYHALLVDLISELDDNLASVRRPREGDAYRRPSVQCWRDNRNKVGLPEGLHSEVTDVYRRFDAWSDVVNSGLHPNMGSMELNATFTFLKSKLPILIAELKNLLTSQQ